MTVLTLILFAMLFLLPLSVSAEAAGDHRLAGIGIVLGEPTGISATIRPGTSVGYDFAAAWSFSGDPSLYFHATAHFPFAELEIDSPHFLGFYWGVGPVARVANNFTLGVRFPLGMTYQFVNAPFELFTEIALGMLIFPDTRPQSGAGLGIRYQF
ncbi:hypothetical protein JCM12856_05250 [Spirochaeta dissipatitropha]